MVTLHLDKIFNPRSVAVIGASDEEDTVGYALIKNFTELGFEGKVYPVNIRKTEILGLKAHQTIDQIPEPETKNNTIIKLNFHTPIRKQRVHCG